MILTTLRAGGVRFGPCLQLSRAPVFLRFVMTNNDRSTLDALDKEDDAPRSGERVIAAKLSNTGNVHLHCARGSKIRSGFHQTAEYEILAEQPAQEVLRNKSAWMEWAMAEYEAIKSTEGGE